MKTASFVRTVAALLLFGTSFGYVEAAVVVYLRALYDPIHQRLHPDRASDDLFPLIRLDELDAEGPAARHRLNVELVREVATIAMLAGIAIAVGRNRHEAFAAFLVAFGIWDLAFYGFLKVLIDWPASFFTWDLLFLLPLPWTGPVLAPMLVAVAMIGSGLFVIARESDERPLRLTRAEWAAVCAGGLVVVAAFCWDYRGALAGRLPQPFPWPIWAFGLGLGLAGFLKAASNASVAQPALIPEPNQA